QLCPALSSTSGCTLPRAHPRSPLFPYTTLFRSHQPVRSGQGAAAVTREGVLAGHARALEPVGRALLVMLLGRDGGEDRAGRGQEDRKSTRLNSSHVSISYAVFCLKKKI